MNWHDCIKSHHKGLGQVKTCFRMEKKEKKRNGKEKEKVKEKDRIEKNWQQRSRQVWTCLVFVWSISPCCEIVMSYDANWQECLRQV